LLENLICVAPGASIFKVTSVDAVVEASLFIVKDHSTFSVIAK
jgi:hypothetical protein